MTEMKREAVEADIWSVRDVGGKVLALKTILPPEVVQAFASDDNDTGAQSFSTRGTARILYELGVTHIMFSKFPPHLNNFDLIGHANRVLFQHGFSIDTDQFFKTQFARKVDEVFRPS